MAEVIDTTKCSLFGFHIGSIILYRPVNSTDVSYSRSHWQLRVHYLAFILELFFFIDLLIGLMSGSWWQTYHAFWNKSPVITQLSVSQQQGMNRIE